MTPAPDSSPDEHAALRRQLILAQVQLMELEDAHDDLRTQLAAARELLAQTQRLGDQALTERDRADLAQRNLQAALATLQAGEIALRSDLASAREREAALAARLSATETQLAARDLTLGDMAAAAAARQARLDQIESERRTMKASRSWRWTAPLRALERTLRRRGDTPA